MHEPLDVAARACVEELRGDGGIGGVIALDNSGNGEWVRVKRRCRRKDSSRL